jgi:hypothetical protein
VRVTGNGSPVLYDEETITVTVMATAVTTSAVSADAPAMTKEAEAKTQIAATTLYPNPVSSRFTVHLKAPAAQLTFAIRDVKGSVVYTKKQTVGGQQFQVDAAALRPGQYLLQLETEQGVEVLKFTKL